MAGIARIGVRALGAALVVVIVYWPFASFYWCVFQISPYNATTGAHAEYVSGPSCRAAYFINDRAWRISLALGEAAAGCLASIGVFIAMDRLFPSAGKRETLCRRCRRVLRNLAEPKCPMCGEPL